MIETKDEATVAKVRDEYAKIAERRSAGENASCCSQNHGYETTEIEALPGDADLGLGCGAPIPELQLKAGEIVLDLGSGGGIDVFLAAKEVGADGRVIGVDMTPEMLELARKNAAKGGYDNVEFREGRLEQLPVDDGSIDAVTSNCVINLVPDKAAVFTEVVRVLRPGGRLAVSDIVLERPLPQALVEAMEVGNCINTAQVRETYLQNLHDAGFAEVTVLRDVDYLEAAGWGSADAMNAESQALLKAAGVSYDDIRGTVRSITFRAVKPV